MKDRYAYVAVLEDAADGSFGVYFPDLPGCTSGGDTAESAMQNAREALLLHLCGMEEDRDEIPEASDLTKIYHANNELPFLVDVNYKLYKSMKGRKRKTCTLTIPESLYEAAKESKVNMSQVFQDALREELGIN